MGSIHRADDFVHLHVHSQYSFLDGASRCAELVARCAELGMGAIAITDHDNVSCAVEFSRAAAEHGIKPIHGVELTMEGGFHLVLLAQNAQGYANICAILTEAHMNSERRHPRANMELLRRHSDNLIALSGCRRGAVASGILCHQNDRARSAVEELVSVFGRQNVYIELQQPMAPGASALNSCLASLAEMVGVGVVASNNVHYAEKSDFEAHDVLTCVRTLTCLDDIHPERHINAENYLKSAAEMRQMLAHFPGAIENTLVIAERCEPGLDLGRKLFPKYSPPSGESSAALLRRLTMEGAAARYGNVTPAVRDRLEHELNIITTLGFEDYFLAVYDIAAWARQQRIRYAGRGSAADSAVAYCLWLTNVDSIARGLLFERFMSLERAQRPDVDIDFQADRRDEVADYVYKRYGSGYVASVCTFNTFQARSAVRDVGKALGIPEHEVDRLAKMLPHIPADGVRAAFSRYPELRDSGIQPHRFDLLIDICARLTGLPRHIGTHLGGMVISGEPLTCVTPLQMSAKGVPITQFDKDSIEDLGLIKLDLLSLRTLCAVEYAGELIKEPSFDYDAIPHGDESIYSMLRSGQTIGVFQLESPAQRALQSRLGADCFEDIVASVALIRPGPIQGNMVEPFVARRLKQEEVYYVDPRLEPILNKTYGVVLYQEQVIQIATAVAGFTPGESDRLRKVMTHYRSVAEMEAIGQNFIAKAVAHGTDRQTAETIFSYIVGYSGYGFCEAHAAAFADTAYRTAYLVKHHPAEFFASLLSAQPMGFYAPRTLIVEAKRRGVKLLPLDVNASSHKYTVENGAIRVGLMQVKGISESDSARIEAARANGLFVSAADFAARVELPVDVFENLALAGAFDSIEPNRRALVWRVRQISARAMAARRLQAEADCTGQAPLVGLVAHTTPVTQAMPAAASDNTGNTVLASQMPGRASGIPDFNPLQRFSAEMKVLGFGIERHAMDFYRRSLKKWGALTAAQIGQATAGAIVRAGGLIVRPHRPPTKSGRIVVFLSLEDETGLTDVTVFEDVYQKYGAAIFSSAALLVEGIVCIRGGGVSITASRIRPLMGRRGQACPPQSPASSAHGAGQ